jgi:hypothetical protein
MTYIAIPYSTSSGIRKRRWICEIFNEIIIIIINDRALALARFAAVQ